jgi:carbon storage regulator
MVVLSRKKNESLTIGDDIIVTVIEIRGDKVRLGIEAPRDMPLHRKEVYDAIRGFDSAAASPVTPSEVRQLDKIDHLAAALQARLAVSVNREIVVQAMHEAGIELPASQPATK